VLGFYHDDQAKAEPKWVDYKDFNPDHCSSSAGMWVEPDDKGSYRWVMAVKGLGAMVMRAEANADTGRLEFKGMSEFTDAEIGHRK
jgi:hypothetical protein